jgi:hypothetical protein
MIKKWKDLTSSERCEGLIAFSESEDGGPCTKEEFEEWILSYHRERLNPEDHFVDNHEKVCESPTLENI